MSRLHLGRIRILDPVQPVEQMEIREYRAELFAQARDSAFLERSPVDLDNAAVRRIEPRQQAQRRRLAAAVTTNQEQRLTGVNDKIQRTDMEPGAVAAAPCVNVSPR